MFQQFKEMTCSCSDFNIGLHGGDAGCALYLCPITSVYLAKTKHKSCSQQELPAPQAQGEVYR